MLQEGNPHSAYRMLPLVVREADQQAGRRLLERFLGGVQERFDLIYLTAKSLLDLSSFEKCPEAYLDHLAWKVGWTDISAHRDLLQGLAALWKRRLIKAAIPLWRRRGSDEGLSEIISLVSGKDHRILDWFYYRLVADEGILDLLYGDSDPWAVSASEAYVTSFRVVDDGALDRALLVKLLALARPVNERFSIWYLLLLDFFRDPSQWATAAGNPPTVVDGELYLEDGDTARTDVAGDTSWFQRSALFRLRAQETDSPPTMNLALLYISDDDYYNLAVNISAKTARYYKRVGGGSVVPLSSATPIPFEEGRYYAYGLELETYQEGGTWKNELRLRIDGVLYITCVDSPRSHTAGRLGVGAYRCKIWVSLAEVSPLPPELDQVGPPVRIQPRVASVPATGSKSFSAFGGTSPYTWSMEAAPSGGSVDSSGNYTAGATSGVTDIVKVADIFDSFALAYVAVT